MQKEQRIRITYFFRKSKPYYNSIERVFSNIIDHLPEEVDALKYFLQSGDRGFFSRIIAFFEIKKHANEINHITGDISYLALALPKKKLIITFHDLESLDKGNYFKRLILKWFWVILPARRAQLITVISEHTKNKVIEWTKVSDQKIHIIHNPLPLGFELKKKEFNTELPTILAIGTKQNKNLEGTITAIREIKCKLLIIGKLTSEQVDLLNRYKINFDNIPRATDSEIIDAYRSADILCFPSFFEGFGLPIIEAQSIGCLVITSNFGAMREVAGTNGAFLVNPSNISEITNAVNTLINDSNLRDSILKSGEENVKKYTPNAIVNKYLEMYKLL